jgi:type I restriction enzyme, S subunit
MRRGELPNERLDPGFVRNANNLNYFAYPKRSLESLISEEPCYGSSARAIERTDVDQPRYIRITDYGEDGITLPHEFMTAEEWLDKHILSKGDLLFARSGATVGKTYLHDLRFDPAVFAGYCIRFRFKDEVLSEYVYGFTKTDVYSSWVGSIQRPAGQPNINKEEFKSLEIPLPPLEIQHRLVGELDAARAERDRSLVEADRLLSSIDEMVKYNLGLPNLEMSSKRGYAIRLATAIRSNILSADYFHPERMQAIKLIQSLPNAPLSQLVSFKRNVIKTPGDTRYIGLASVSSGTGQLTNAVETAMGQCFAFESGDVLYGRLRPYLNKVWLADFEGVCSTEFHVMRSNDSNKLRPEYLSVVMRTNLIVAQTRHMMTGNTHPRIANEDVVNLVIPLADPEEQKIIVEETRSRQEESVRLRTYAETVWREARERFEQQLLQGGVA